MNSEQEYQIARAAEQVSKIRRTIAELESLGWELTEPLRRALHAYDVFRGALGENAARVEKLTVGAKDYEYKLSSLLSEENTYVQSVIKAAGETQAALDEAEVEFFAGRYPVLETFDKQIVAADGAIQKALAGLIGALQERWKLMQRKHEVAARFQDISQAHNTPESFGAGSVNWGKPFNKMNSAIWPVFLASFLQRLDAVLPNCETTAPADAVRTVFERVIVPDIGHDENSRQVERARSRAARG